MADPSAQASPLKLTLVALHLEPSPRAMPLGPAMIAAALRRAFPTQIQTRLFDGYVQQSAAACAEAILATEPDWVGFSMYVWNRTQCLEIATLLKARKPQLVLFAGGAEATADWAGVQAHPAMDFVVPGEGETQAIATLAQLLQGSEISSLKSTGLTQPVLDLSALASPFLDGTLDLSQYRGALWELSRGCPFTCDFCYEARGTAGTRRMPLERIEAELACFVRSGIREVFVLDPTFNHHREHAKGVLRLIAETAPPIHFFFEVRSEFLDAEMAALFAAIPCTLQIGLQSAHDAVLRSISRSFDPEDFEAKILLLHQAGVPYGFDLIYGLPGDTLEGFRASVDFAMSMVPNHLDLFRLSVLPGTRLAETAPGFGLVHQPHNPYAVVASPTFSAADLARAECLAAGCDAFYNLGKAVPWFDIVLSALQRAPSDVFEQFGAALGAQPPSDFLALQRDFIVSLFEAQGDGLMGSLAADLITYFGHAAELLDAPEDTSDRTVVFQHDPTLLLSQLQEGNTDLESLVFSVPAQTCTVRMSLEAGAVIMDVLEAH